MSLPRNAAHEPSLSCKLCGSAIFIGNDHKVCYVCMAISQRQDLGKEENVGADGMLSRDYVSLWSQMYLLAGYNRRVVELKRKITSRCHTGNPSCTPELVEMLQNVLNGRQPKEGPPAPIEAAKAAPVEVPAPPKHSDLIERIDKFLKRPAFAIECHNCAGAGHFIEPIMESPHCKTECGVCDERGWVFGPTVIVPDDEEPPADNEWKRAGDVECSVCGVLYSKHQLHRFGDGPVPLLLRRICDRPHSTVKYVKL